MSILSQIIKRSNNNCELCKASLDSSGVEEFIVPPHIDSSLDNSIVICSDCKAQISETTDVNSFYWRFLGETMWSENDAVKVISYAMLKKLKNEDWANDLLEMFYADEETQKWANDCSAIINNENRIVHRDSNNSILENGDTVVLIKDLQVKGSSLVAKRGTSVRNIRLDRNNDEYIEGKVNGQQIVILTKYVKK